MKLSIDFIIVLINVFALFGELGGDNITPVNKENTVERNTTNLVISTGTTPIVPTQSPLLPGFKLPCACAEGQCGCCTGVVLDWFRQKACLNITYDPDDFALTAAMSMNGNTLYKRTVSGKNPPPMCARLPRIPFIRFCVRFSNIYFASRNIHFCIDMEANWEDTTLLEWSFDCVRMGTGGLAVVAPEEGGGIPSSPIDIVDQTDEDYDDSARNIPLKTSSFNTIIFDKSVWKLANETFDKHLIEIKEISAGNILIFKSNSSNNRNY